MIGDKIHDLAHPCLYDICKVLYADLFCRHAPKTGYRDISIGFRFVGEGGTELYFHLLSLCFQHPEAGLDIVGDILSSEGNDRGVFKDAFIKDRQVRGTPTDIDDGTTALQVFLTHDTGTGS